MVFTVIQLSPKKILSGCGSGISRGKAIWYFTEFNLDLEKSSMNPRLFFVYKLSYDSV